MSNNKYKILVVEDDRNILSMIQTILDSNGYQVLSAQRCQQGILMLSSHVPDPVALDEVLEITLAAFRHNDPQAASSVEPLEQVIDHLKTIPRNRHIDRLKRAECSVEAGFIWADLLNSLERASDHCSNIAISIMDAHEHNMNAHQSLRSLKEGNPAFFEKLDDYSRKYQLPME